MSHIKNQVLTDNARTSENFFKSDRILKHYLKKHLSGAALEYMEDKLSNLGARAATSMNELSMQADRQSPTLEKRTPTGKPSNTIKFHPAYDQLLDIAAESEMFYVKYDPKLRKTFSRERHRLGFAVGQIYAMSELGVYCPLCMTDGAAHLVQKHAPEEIRNRTLHKLSARNGDELYTGAMFLTEKPGGSDVGRNLTTAVQLEGNKYKLNGEKWFCSNVNAEVIMALARTGKVEDGTRGLSLFVVEKELPDGTRNPMKILRLKDKLGVRSMATAEVKFKDTIGIRLGEENKGFKLMAEMINISRVYNAVAAIAGSRRAITEVWQYLNHRIIFDKKATEHAMIRQKFHELQSLYLGDFYLVWRAIQAMDESEQGKETENQLKRILVPMAKWRTADHAVYIVRECMELMGGNGYIEDFVMPKLLRDINVLPIWEGSGNVIVLDILRAAKKSNGLQIIFNQIDRVVEADGYHGSVVEERFKKWLSAWESLQQEDDRDVTEATAKPLFKKLMDIYQMVLMINERDEITQKWIDPALKYLASSLEPTFDMETPPQSDTIEDLMGWEY